MQDVFGQVGSLFSLVSPWDAMMVGTEVKNFRNFPFWMISGNFPFGVFLVHFLHVISAVFFVIKLVVFVVAYIVSNIALVLKRQEILFRSFLVLLAFNWFIFSWRKRQTNKISITVHFSPNNYFELKLIVLNNV